MDPGVRRQHSEAALSVIASWNELVGSAGIPGPTLRVGSVGWLPLRYGRPMGLPEPVAGDVPGRFHPP